MEQIRTHQFSDDKLCTIQDKVLRGEAKSSSLDLEGILRINGRICLPKTGDWVRMILEHEHCANYSIY